MVHLSIYLFLLIGIAESNYKSLDLRLERHLLKEQILKTIQAHMFEGNLENKAYWHLKLEH